MRARTIIGGVLVALGLMGSVVAAPVASAEQVTTADPAGDGTGAGDLRSLRASQHPNTLSLTFQVRTNLPFNTAGPAWTSATSATSLNINLATDGGSEVDYQLRVFATASGPELEFLAVAHGPSPRGLCGFQLTFPQPTIIRVQLNGPMCVGDPDSVRAFARLRFDKGGNNTIDSDDRAPNRGYGPRLDVTLTN